MTSTREGGRGSLSVAAPGVARLETVSATKTVFCVILDAMGKYQTQNVCIIIENICSLVIC